MPPPPPHTHVPEGFVIAPCLLLSIFPFTSSPSSIHFLSLIVPLERYAGTDVKTHYFGQMSPMYMSARARRRARMCFCSAILTVMGGGRRISERAFLDSNACGRES